VGISYGLFVFNQDEDLFVGPPLVKAYEIGEAAQWIGTVLEVSVAELVASNQSFGIVPGCPW
jgi:hypothetical protein